MSRAPFLRRLRRPATLLAVAAVLAAGMTACGQRETFDDEVRAAIAKTRLASTQFVYSDVRFDRQIQVQGLVEDDFRFKAAVDFDGAPAYEQVVVDDALAVRFLDPARIRNVLSPEAADADLKTEMEGVNSLDALRTRRWVVDGTGAPLLTASGRRLQDLGRDPVLDAVTALDYLEEAVRTAVAVDRWSADSLDPTYPTSEDSFPEPEDGSGVIRYDLRRPDFPALANTTGDAAGLGLPNVRHFRKVAIYVKDGVIIQAIERIEATGKRLQQFEEYLLRALEAFKVEQSLRDQLTAAVSGARTEAELSEVLFAALNTMLVALGQEPVLTRAMTLSVPSEGTPPTGGISLPISDVINGSLAALATSAEGQQAFLERREASSTGGADGGATGADGATGDGGGSPTDSEGGVVDPEDPAASEEPGGPGAGEAPSDGDPAGG